MKKIVFLLFIFASAPGMGQQWVTEREAIMGASKAMKAYHNCDFQVNRTFHDVSEQGDTLLYEVAMSNGFSVLISGSKAYTPVLAVYKNNQGQSIFDPNISGGPASLVNSYRREIKRHVDSASWQYYATQWNALLDTADTIGNLRNVSNLLTSSWGESVSNDGIDLSAYNEMCPYINNCNALAGSAAVAMGQIMYYWNYPFFLLSDGQFFNWCNMGDEILTTDECYVFKKKSISELLGVCGEKSLSDYSCTFTQTAPDDVIAALSSYFEYNTNNEFEQTPIFPDPNLPPGNEILFNNFWNNIRDDIDNEKPILGYLRDGDSKYYFVCDDYFSNYSIQINWGDLNGSYNGEYNIINEFDIFLLFDLSPRINYTVGNYLYLSNYYTNCASQAGLLPLYSIVPYTATSLTSADVNSDTMWRYIPSGASSVYQAQEEIILQNGFEAKYGSDFEARIIPCEECEEIRGNNNETEDCVDGGEDVSSEVDAFSLSVPHTNTPDLFPNPTRGPLTMVTDGMAESVIVFDLLGHPVGGWHLETLMETAVVLDVSPLRPGPYLLTVTTSVGSRTVRFLRL